MIVSAEADEVLHQPAGTVLDNVVNDSFGLPTMPTIGNSTVSSTDNSTDNSSHPIATTVTPYDTAAGGDNWWNPEYGIRGGSTSCETWYATMPGSFFQLFCLFLHLAFIASGNSSSAAMYNNITCALAFLSLAVWGGTGLCGADVIVWGVIIFATNAAQVAYAYYKSNKTQRALEGDQNKVYNQFFAPFEISRTLFTDLVSVKGFHMMTLQKDHCYAIENKTTVDRLALLVSGKLRVHTGDKVLHYIQKNDFIDSPEWEALKGSNKKTAVFRVTITAETTCRCIVWKRKPLLALLSKEKQLNKIINCVIGNDILKKLTVLNSRRFTDRGFHYDVRLPCVISLRDDVEERERRMLAQMTPNAAAGQRSRKLGRRAAQDYAKLFGPKLDVKEDSNGGGFLRRETTNFISELEDD